MKTFLIDKLPMHKLLIVPKLLMNKVPINKLLTIPKLLMNKVPINNITNNQQSTHK